MAPVTSPRSLQDLKCIGPASIAWLNAIGVTTVAHLRKMGAPKAYELIAYRFGREVNRNLLYALDQSLRGHNYNDLTEARKKLLCAAAGVPFRSRPRRAR
jgi:hypothetical protein